MNELDLMLLLNLAAEHMKKAISLQLALVATHLKALVTLSFLHKNTAFYYHE